MNDQDIKDIDEVLDQADYSQKAKPTLEADASCNIVGYYRGFRIMTTQRNPSLDMAMFIDKAIKDIDYMVARGFKPSWADDTNSKNTQISTQDASTTNISSQGGLLGRCDIHNVQMKQYTKNGKSWYSHMLRDGTWCTGRAK